MRGLVVVLRIFHSFHFHFFEALRRSWLRGTSNFVFHFILGFRKFTNRLAHSLCKLGQLLGAEEKEDDEEDHHAIRSGKIGKKSDIHRRWGYRFN